jgi:hypothetical protein
MRISINKATIFRMYKPLERHQPDWNSPADKVARQNNGLERGDAVTMSSQLERALVARIGVIAVAALVQAASFPATLLPAAMAQVAPSLPSLMPAPLMSLASRAAVTAVPVHRLDGCPPIVWVHWLCGAGSQRLNRGRALVRGCRLSGGSDGDSAKKGQP